MLLFRPAGFSHLSSILLCLAIVVCG